MKYHFYTQFDKGFLARAIALYNSIEEHCKEPFQFWMLCFDDISYDLLKKMNLPHITALRASDIETDELREIKKQRKLNEYYWTVGPNGLMHVMQKYQPEALAYLDADMLFYASPKTIFDEFAQNSVLIAPHRLGTYAKSDVKDVGKYNVGMIIFRNDTSGKDCLEWWRKRCNEWCYDRIEDGKYGDQKYLDEFPEKFKGVYVIEHKGVDLAPWNIENYAITKRGDAVFVDDQQLILYHFAKLKIYYPYQAHMPVAPIGLYTLPSIEKKYIYAPYFTKLYQAIEQIERFGKPFPFGTVPRPSGYKQLKNVIGGWLSFGRKSK